MNQTEARQGRELDRLIAEQVFEFVVKVVTLPVAWSSPRRRMHRNEYL